MENDNIKKLEELLNDGVLTQEEFESKKAEILNNNNSEETNVNSENLNEAEVSSEKPKKKSNNLIIGVLVISVAVIGYIFLTQPTKLELAFENCSLREGISVGLDSNGKGLFLDGKGEEDTFGVSISKQLCVLRELEMPSTVRNQINNTNSLMGVRTAEWDDISIEWSYHPDDGFNLTINED
tara:strand:- start:118 stop:663 length:546 start_codon:yes stop_codon:yes gene_type:complete